MSSAMSTHEPPTSQRCAPRLLSERGVAAVSPPTRTPKLSPTFPARAARQAWQWLCPRASRHEPLPPPPPAKYALGSTAVLAGGSPFGVLASCGSAAGPRPNPPLPPRSSERADARVVDCKIPPRHNEGGRDSSACYDSLEPKPRPPRPSASRPTLEPCSPTVPTAVPATTARVAVRTRATAMATATAELRRRSWSSH